MKRLTTILSVVLCFFANTVNGQSTGNYVYSTAATGSLLLAEGITVDMSTGTSLLVGAGLNSTESAVTNIGFDFYLQSNYFTQFSVQDDGVIQLGSTQVTSPVFNIAGGTPTAPRLSPFSADTRTGTSGKIHSKVFGTAPNRVLIVEFKNMQLFNGTATAGTSTYQARLYEKGEIEFVYGTMSATDVSVTPQASTRRATIGFYTGSANGAFANILYSNHASTTTGAPAPNAAVATTGDITNLTSTNANQRRFYKYVPIVPATSPSALIFSSVTGSSMNLSWTAPGVVTNIVKYAVYGSSNGGTSYSFYNAVNVGTNNVTVSGLSQSTTYLWKVYSLSEGALSTGSANGTQATSAAPVISNVTVPVQSCNLSARTINADITTSAGTITSVILNYNNGSAGSVPMTLQSGNTYSASIPAAASSPTTVTWSITATNSGAAAATFNGASYSDDPLTGITVSASANPGSVCAGTAVTLTALVGKDVTATVGAGTATTGGGTTAAAQVSPFQHYYGSVKSQYLIRASELQAAGLFAGNIKSIGLNVTTADAVPLQGLTVSFAATALTAQPATLVTSGFVTVYNATTTPIVGLNTLVFNIANYNWDGTSNIIVQFCWGNNNTGNGAGFYRVKSDPTSYVSNAYYRSDNLDAAASCASTSGGDDGTNSARPQFVFLGNGSGGAATYSWSDGTNTVGTTNPLTVNPSTTTTYTATITLQGCPKNSNAVVVTVTGLPAAPSGNNSTQCGLAVPTAFVTSSGGNGGFKWYDAETGGNLLQTGGSTYETAISSTTHFWVSESNGTCESLRTDVLVTVNSPDPVQATVDISSPCPNTEITLNAANTAATPTNSYTYSWMASPQLGSGLPANSTSGNPLPVTPTVAGSYTYTVTAMAGVCVTTSTVSVIVKALPADVVITPAVPLAVCSGNTVALNAVSGGSGNVTATSGAINITIPDHNATGINNPLVVTGVPTGATVDSVVVTFNVSHSFVEDMVLSLEAPNGQIINLVSGLVASGGNFTNTSVTSNNTKPTMAASVAPYTATFKADAITSGFEFAPAVLPTTSAWGNLYSIPNGTWKIRVHDDASLITGTLTNWSIKLAYTLPSNPITWSLPSGLNSTSGSNVNASPAVTTTYTATATNPGGCTTSNTVTVSINQPPPALSPLNGTDQCGTALTDASVSSNSADPSPVFQWYNAAAGGTLLQSGPSPVYLTAIGVTTTFYVSELSSFGCEGPRVAVTTTVSDPDPITVTATSTNFCLGTSIDISSTYTAEFNSFSTFDLTATGGDASGVTGTVSLTPNGDGSEPQTVTPTETGTYTYTITAIDNDKNCVSVGTVVVNVGSLPSITNASASPATAVCAGTPVSLSAVTNVIAPGTRTVGAGTGSNGTSTTVGAFYATYYGNGHTQILYTAAELTAAGLYPGNITSLGTVLSSIGSSPVTVNAFTIKIGATAATAITTFQSPTFTTVYGPTNYTPVVGTNTHTFTTPFNWDGTSNIIVDYCFANGLTGVPSNTSVNTYTTTGFASFVNYQVDGAVSDPCANTTVSNTSSNRPNLIFIGQVFTTGAGSYSWSWNPGNLSGNTVTVTPTTTTTYTATATFNGCSANSAPVTVTVNPLPAAPSTNDPVTRCGPGTVTLNATGTGGALNWYNVSSGGTSLQTGGVYAPNVASNTIFFVAETSAAGCEGLRSAVNVIVTSAPTLAITPSAATTFCLGNAITLNGTSGSSSSYINFAWLASPLTGSGLSSTTGAVVTATPTLSGTYTYTLTANDGAVNGCSNTATVVVTVNSNPIIASATASPAAVCAGGASTLSATTNTISAGSSSSTGSGTTLTTASSIDPTAFNNRYSQYWGQYVYTAAELHAAGLEAGNITALTFNINTIGDAASNSNFSISIGTTSVSTLTSFVTTGLTQVLAPTTYTHAVGLNTITFTTPFNWDGVSNLIIDQRHDGINSLTNARTFFTATAGNTVISAVTSTTSSTTSLQTEVQNSTASPNFSTKRLNIIFTGQVGAIGAGNLNYTWNPGNLSGSSVIVNPTTSTTYTVTATNPATGCSVTGTPLTVTVTPVAANATATPATPVCAGTSVTLNAGASGGGPFSYSWSNGAAVVGTTSPLTVNPTVTTSYTVTVTDACSNVATSVLTVNVNPLPSVSIAETGPISICAPASQLLTAGTDAASASYQWQLNEINIPGANASTYTVTASGSYTVVVTNTVTTCVSVASAAVVVTVNAKPTTVTVTPATAIICNGTIVPLTAAISMASVTSGTGASTSAGNSTTATLGPNPFQIYYGGDKQQSLYLASELSALGMGAGSVISAVKFNLPTANPAVSLANLRVKMKLTTTSSLATWEPSMIIVRAASAFTPAVGVNTIPLTTLATWDGVSNLVVEVTYSNNNSGTTGGPYNTARYSPTTFQSTILYRDDLVSAGAFNTYTGAVSFSYNSRNDMTFDFTNPGTITWSPQAGLFTNAGATTAYTGGAAASVYASPSTTTTYTATATSSAGCTNSATSVITVNPRPTGVISGGATYCEGQGSTTTTLSIAVTGAGPWSGTLAPGAIPFSGSSSPITVAVTPTTTTTYTIATLNGFQCNSIAADLTGSATVTVNPTPATPTISPAGPITQCGGTVTLTSSSATGNQWNNGGSPIVGATNQTLVVSASGNYSVSVTNGSNCSATSLVTSVTINPAPATPTVSANGPLVFCEGGSVTLTSSSATSNQWNLGGAPIGGATSQTLVVTASGDYTVTVTNGFSCSATSAITMVTANPSAATPTASVVQPTCAVATGTINVTSPLGAGNTYSLDGVNFQSGTSFPGKAPGTYTLYVNNSFGCFAPATVNVTVDPQPFIPAAPTVTGIVNVCPYIAPTGGAPITFHASSPGATSYSWTIPAARVIVVSGQGTADLTVRFDTGYINVPNKQFRVKATSVCGTSALTVFYTLAQYPATPNPITGPSDACPYIGTATTVTYTTNKALSATGYIWTLPAGVTATHPNPAGENDTTIVVTFTSGFTVAGNITVNATNDCGTSGARNIFVSRNPPPQPGLITGPVNACEFSAPNGTPATYSVVGTPGVIYTWTPPAGYTNLTGQGTNSISFIYPNGFTTGTLSVIATSGCGTSVPRNLSIYRYNPAVPGVIDVIQTHFCGEGVNSREFTYQVSSMPAQAVSVQWTVPASATLVSGQGTTMITVSYPDAAVSGYVTAQGVSNCASGTVRSTTVHLPACPPPGFAGTGNKDNPQLKGITSVVTPAPAETMEVKIFPNPTVSDFKLQVMTSQSEVINVRVFDNEGRLFKTFKLMPNQTIALGAELKAGSYMVEVRQGKNVKTTKVIKF